MANSIMRVRTGLSTLPPISKKYCCCLDSRIGTKTLAIWQMIMHLIAISALVAVILKPDLMDKLHHHEMKMQRQLDTMVKPRIIATHEQTFIDARRGSGFVFRQYVIGVPKQHPMSHPEDKPLSMEDVGHFKSKCRLKLPMLLTFTLFSFLFTYMLYVGVACKRPFFMLPYFSIQVLDYCLSSLSMVCFVSYLPHVKYWLSQKSHVPFKHDLMQMHSASLAILLLVMCLGILALKAFLMGLVWHCYRSLRLELIMEQRRTITQQPITAIVEISSNGEKKMVPPIEKPVLPTYEKCIEAGQEQRGLMPPPYIPLKGEAEDDVEPIPVSQI